MPKRTHEIDASEACPCGSGDKYQQCCQTKNFRWERDHKGDLLRSTPVSPELEETIRAAKYRFEDIFCRKMRNGDPYIFEQYYMSQADLDRQILSTMKSTGISPSLAYAYNKTGRMVSEHNQDMLTPDEMKEWDDAIDEYYDRIESGEEFDPFDKAPNITYLKDDLKNIQIIAGSFLNRYFNKYRKRKGASRDTDTIVAFSTTNFVRCLKSIHILLENDVAYDAYPLVRILYENYLSVKYIYKYPSNSEIQFAHIGVALGTHNFAKNRDGGQIHSKIVEKSTGRVLDIPTRKSMAVALGQHESDLYESIYRELSSHVHSEITNIGLFLSDRGYDYQSHNFSVDVLCLTHFLSLLFFVTIRNNANCPNYLYSDLTVIAHRGDILSIHYRGVTS